MMDLSKEEQETLQAIFREEANEQLDELARLLETLPGEPCSALDAGIRVCFRIAHNIKGAALSVGFPGVAELAHAIESSFVEARSSGQPCPPPASGICSRPARSYSNCFENTPDKQLQRT